ncbi:MAG: hypothetical protein EOS14_34330 [Mesorhizobium sp.]|nr:MAG: hypothetical protein EOS14_34330 [Mesorhizobium sp.]
MEQGSRLHGLTLRQSISARKHGSPREHPQRLGRPQAGLQAIEQTCPAGVLPSEEAVVLLYGPEPVHEGEALAKAIIETVNRLTG